MTPEQFCYWLQGHFEIDCKGEVKPIDVDQVKVIRTHLGYVFSKLNPVDVIPGRSRILDQRLC